MSVCCSFGKESSRIRTRGGTLGGMQLCSPHKVPSVPKRFSGLSLCRVHIWSMVGTAVLVVPHHAQWLLESVDPAWPGAEPGLREGPSEARYPPVGSADLHSRPEPERRQARGVEAAVWFLKFWDRDQLAHEPPTCRILIR